MATGNEALAAQRSQHPSVYRISTTHILCQDPETPNRKRITYVAPAIPGCASISGGPFPSIPCPPTWALFFVSFQAQRCGRMPISSSWSLDQHPKLPFPRVSPSISSNPFFIGTISQVQVDVWQVPGTFALPKKKNNAKSRRKISPALAAGCALGGPGPFQRPPAPPPGTTETARKPHCDVARQATSLASPAAWQSPSPSLFCPPVAVCRDVRPVSLRPLPLAEQRC